MNREDIIAMAREAGFTVDDADFITAPKSGRTGFQLELERFATLAYAAGASAERERIKDANAPVIESINAHIKALEEAVFAEREACAKVCEQEWNDYCVEPSGYALAVKECAAAIRERGGTK